MILDYRKLERPERSGVLAVMIVYLSLCFYGEVNGNWDPSEGFSLDNLSCMFFPWECMRHEHVQEIEPQRPPERVTPLIFCPRCKVRKHEKGCHFHLDHHNVDGTIDHEHYPEYWPPPEECSFLTEYEAGHAWTRYDGDGGWYRWHVVLD